MTDSQPSSEGERCAHCGRAAGGRQSAELRTRAERLAREWGAERRRQAELLGAEQLEAARKQLLDARELLGRLAGGAAGDQPAAPPAVPGGGTPPAAGDPVPEVVWTCAACGRPSPARQAQRIITETEERTGREMAEDDALRQRQLAELRRTRDAVTGQLGRLRNTLSQLGAQPSGQQRPGEQRSAPPGGRPAWWRRS
jgi:hypothetical protein